MFLVGQQPKIGYDLEAREELVRTYVEKEHDLSEKLEKDRVPQNGKLGLETVFKGLEVSC